MKFIKAALIFVFFLGASPSLRADDIEIYLTPDTISPGDVLVMLNLDWRPSLGSTKCNNDIDVNPDPNVTELQNECQSLVDEGFMLGDGAGGVRSDTTFYDLLTAALKKVIDPLEGLHLGLMINNENDNNCAGPQSPEDCSNGGYVLKGFTQLDDLGPDDPGFTHTCPLLNGVPGTPDPGMTNTPSALLGFCDKLTALPVPQGNESHKFQGEEHFFEFYRYLVGGALWNGHNGINDFGTKTPPDPLRNVDHVLDVDDPRQTPLPDSIAQLTWDNDVEDGALPPAVENYLSPLENAAECSSIFTISLMFQVSQQAADSDTEIEADFSQYLEEAFDISASNSFGPDRGFTNVLDFLHNIDLADGSGSPAVDSMGIPIDLPGDQNVTSYFLVDPTKINNTTNGYARAGGTGSALPLSDDPAELIAVLTQVFAEILTVSTTLVSPSIPVDVFNLAQQLPEFYFSLFEANADGKPRWDGNLKKLKSVVVDFTTDPPTRELQDVNGVNAVADDGRILNSALTYWTKPLDLPDPVVDEDTGLIIVPAGKDGRAITRGGAGGVIPGYRPLAGNTPGLINPGGNTTETSTRKLFTEPVGFVNPGDGSSTGFMEFNAINARAIDLLTEDDKLYQTVMGCPPPCSYNTATATDKDTAEALVEELMAFARGVDVLDEDGDLDFTDARPWIMGAPLHSRPLPLNYGGDIRIVINTNDGIAHMIRAADNDGVEAWGFIPRAVIPVQKRLKDNNAGVPIVPYTVDDSPTALVIDHNLDGNIVTSGAPPNGGDRVYVYFGMRRGGKGVYALDVSLPDAPELLWVNQKGAPGTDFAELGQTWSTPRIVNIRVDLGAGPEIRPALISGGGYNGDDDGDKAGDLGKDARPPGTAVGTDDLEGNAIFIVDALTGELIWKAIYDLSMTGPHPTDATIFTHTGLLDSIPSKMTVIDTFGNGLADRGYVGTTGGDVFRLDLSGPDRSLWTISKVLELGRHLDPTNTITAGDRRFFHPPDFVNAQDDTGDFQAIVIASGDRPHPIGSEVENWLYMFKDRNLTTGFPPLAAKVHTDLADLTSNCLQTGDLVTCNPDPNGPEDLEVLLGDGWRVKLEQCEGLATTGICGEKGLASPLTISGTVFTNTYIPHDPSGPITSCEPIEGGGLLYALDLQNATAVVDFDGSNPGFERFDQLDSDGIPAENVPVVGDTGYIGILPPDLDFLETEAESQQETFWYEQLFQ